VKTEHIDKGIQRINEGLQHKQLKDVFTELGKLVDFTGNIDFRSKLEQLETTYLLMMKYTIDGIVDPERHQIYNNLIENCYLLTDKLADYLYTQHSNAYVYSQKRVLAPVSPDSYQQFIDRFAGYFKIADTMEITDLRLISEHLASLNMLFQMFWTNSALNEQQRLLFLEIVNHNDIPDFEKSAITSALFLSGIRDFDVAKFHIFFNLIESKNPDTSERALFSLLILLFIWEKRLPFFPEIVVRLELLCEDKGILNAIEKILLLLIQTKDTEKIMRKFHDEIFPEMAKMNPNLRKKLGLDNLLNEAIEDKNPDWENLLEESPKLTQSLRELTNLQLEGADVFMSTFSALKNFPFFSSLGNWFIPFSLKHPEIADLAREFGSNSFFSLISNSQFLCNSDKYSFILSMQQIPKSYRDMMVNALQEQNINEQDIKSAEIESLTNRNIGIYSKAYIQDLYRFFKLHPQHREFTDIFALDLNFFEKRFFNIIVQQQESLRKIADYYFEKNYFTEALHLFDMILAEKPADSTALQKAGFCAQKLGRYALALSYYEKSDIIASDNLWTIKKMALCYRQLQQPEKALAHYLKIEKSEPDNTSVYVYIGHCYMELEKYEEALKCYYRVAYIQPDNHKVWRPIVWCSIMNNKIEQAESYSQKVLNNDPNPHDYMHAGHIALIKNQRKAAIVAYKNCINKLNGGIQEFSTLFEDDYALLLNRGFDYEDLAILLDSIRYSLEEN